MRWFSSAARLGLALTLGALTPSLSSAQNRPVTLSPQTAPTKTVEASIAEALLANPFTAPYLVSIESRDGRVVLKGRVGSKAVHDAVVRTAIAFGAPIADELIIDTRVMLAAPWPIPGGPGLLTSYTYPPPLFGRFDDPFFGFEPPLITYPIWWGEMSQRRVGLNPIAPKEQANVGALPLNTVEMTIDPLGVAVIRGTVPTEADKATIAQHMLQVDGVTRVINKLTVDPTQVAASPRRLADDEPPPPPTPAQARPVPMPAEPSGEPIRVKAPAPAGLSRADRAIQACPELAGTGVKVSVRDGVASLSGSVPSVYEAMLAYRAVQQTPGVREVVDSIQFIVPDGTSPNPLLTKAKPEDAEAYLSSQIRRQVGDAAHVDRVRIGGNQLEVRGTLERADDRPRIEAILRSMPILRGFTLLPEFRASGG